MVGGFSLHACAVCLAAVCQTGFVPHAASTRLARPGCSLLPASLSKRARRQHTAAVDFRRGRPRRGWQPPRSCGASVELALTWPSTSRYVSYVPRHRSTTQPVPHDAPVGWRKSSFPQASDVGSTGWMLAPRESQCVLSCWPQRFRDRGASPCRWLYDSWGRRSTPLSLVGWPCRLRLVGGGGARVCAQAGLQCPQSLHLVNDLAGTMQPELPPIGRTPLGRSRGFIHDFSPRPVGQFRKGRRAQPQRLCLDAQALKIALAHAVTASETLLPGAAQEGSVKAAARILRAAPHVSP